MRTLTLAIGVLVLAGCTNEPTTPRGARPAPLFRAAQQDRATDKYFIIFVDTVSNVDATAQQLAGTHGGQVLHIYRSALRGFAARLPAQALNGIRQNPAVRYVQQIEAGKFRFHDIAQVNPPWGLDRIDARAGLDQRYNYYENGSGVHIYIVDSGIRTTHVEFGSRATVGFDARPQDGKNGQDCLGHGTHVAGIAAGQTYGVAKAAALVAVKVNVACKDSLDVEDIVAGIDWVATNSLIPAVANMSIGGPPDTTVDLAVQGAIAAGVTFVVSAGNNFGYDACQLSPARVPEAITVGASRSTDARWVWSNIGSCLDIFAPGVNILSAFWTSNTATHVDSGTSMAAPHVTGTVARYLQYKHAATPSDVAAAITSRGTSGVIVDPGTNSPNLLLFSWFVDNTISGTSDVWTCGTYTWTASASGIGSTFTYVWEKGTPTGFGNGFIWGQVGTGPGYATNLCPTSGPTDYYYLRVTATNEFGHHRQVNRTVTLHHV